MRTILVTGANKGVGLGIARGILKHADDTRVLLGSRDEARGQRAIEQLADELKDVSSRLSLVQIDVADDGSVARAKDRVQELLGGQHLYGLVNNAGVGLGAATLADVLAVNTFGVQRVCAALLPLLKTPGGRIVNVTSAAGPNFVAKCSPERQRFFLDPQTSWADISALCQECLGIAGDAAAFAERGLGDGNAYGLSKACANTYTQHLATQHEALHINACTPGLIETDMTRGYVESSGKAPADLGMKSPDEGAKSALFLLFGELSGNGRYYGSDAQRSPLDRYRAPGDPPYAG